MGQHSRATHDDGVIRRPETKSFVLTSEFWVGVAAAAAVFIAGYVLDDIAESTSWKYGTWIAIAYIVSRGLAKAGSQRAYQAEPQANGDGFWKEERRDNAVATESDSVPAPPSRDRERGESYDPESAVN